MDLLFSYIKKYKFVILIYIIPIFVYQYVYKTELFYLILVYTIITIFTAVLFKNQIYQDISNFNFSIGNHNYAEKIYIKLINKGSKNPLIYSNYAIILLNRGDAAPALSILKKALTLNPDAILYKNITLSISSCYWLLNETDKAINTLQKLINDYNYVNSNVLTTMGYLYLLKDDIDKATYFSNKALEDNKEAYSAWDNIGQIEFKKGNFNEAKIAFDKALSLHKYLVDSNYYMGLIFEKEMNLKQAEFYFCKAHECNISALNTVTKEQVKEKYLEYKSKQ